MERHLDLEITKIKQNLLKMAGLAELAIDKSVRALKNREIKLAQEVMEEDAAIDALEIKIENACFTLLARYQPVAADLRFIMASIKINNDLERIGDHAVNIADRAERNADTPPLKPLIDIPYMANIVQDMLKNSLDSFVEFDVSKARAVLENDDVVDGLEDQIQRELLTYMMEDPRSISRAIDLTMVAKNLERIADLSTNIGEEVIFIVEAKNIKHHAEEEQQRPSKS